MTKVTSIAKDFHRLMKRIGRLTDGQASIHDIEWDDITLGKFQVVIKPNSGYYKGCAIKFEIRNLESYQDGRPPTVFCLTKIYHPNIDPTEEDVDDSYSNVCLNILEEGTWEPSLGLEGLVLGLIFLLNNPNIDDPLSPYIESYNKNEFEENVWKYIAGTEIDGVQFDNGMAEIDGVQFDNGMAEIDGVQFDNGMAEIEGKDDNGPVSKTDVSREMRQEIEEDTKVQDTKEEIKVDDILLQKNADDADSIEQKNECVNNEDTRELDDKEEDDDEVDGMLKLISIEGEIMLVPNAIYCETESAKNDEHLKNKDVIKTVIKSDGANEPGNRVTNEGCLEDQILLEEQLETRKKVLDAIEASVPRNGATQPDITASDTNVQILGECNIDKGEKAFEKQFQFSEKRIVKMTMLTTVGLLCTYVCGRYMVKR